MEFRFLEILALIALSYTIFVFISESLYLYRTDHYARRMSSYNRHRRRLAIWCASSVLIAGVLVSLFLDSLKEPASMIIAALIATVLITPAVARYIRSRNRRGV